jgi:hypothetical protein
MHEVKISPGKGQESGPANDEPEGIKSHGNSAKVGGKAHEPKRSSWGTWIE